MPEQHSTEHTESTATYNDEAIFDQLIACYHQVIQKADQDAVIRHDEKVLVESEIILRSTLDKNGKR